MPWKIPVNFSQQASAIVPAGAKNQPPKVIRAADLMENFSYAALDADDSLIETETASGGFQKRKLKIPAVPSSGTKILGCINGKLQWIDTQVCQ